MNPPSPLKEEIKKSVVVEPIKILIGSLLTLVGTLVLAAIPQVRGQIWPLIPKWSLLVLSVAFLSAILALVPFVLRLRRQVEAVKTELDTLKTKPTYPYKFGVKWDADLNPRCPHCESYLSGYTYARMSVSPDISRFVCHGCSRYAWVTDSDSVTPIHLSEAKEKMKAEMPRLDP